MHSALLPLPVAVLLSKRPRARTWSQPRPNGYEADSRGGIPLRTARAHCAGRAWHGVATVNVHGAAQGAERGGAGMSGMTGWWPATSATFSQLRTWHPGRPCAPGRAPAGRAQCSTRYRWAFRKHMKQWKACLVDARIPDTRAADLPCEASRAAWGSRALETNGSKRTRAPMPSTLGTVPAPCSILCLSKHLTVVVGAASSVACPERTLRTRHRRCWPGGSTYEFAS